MTGLTEWQVSATDGDVIDVHLPSRRKRPGRKLSTRTLHKRLVKAIPRPAPRGSIRLMIGGEITDVDASQPDGESFSVEVERHRELLRKRKMPLAAEEYMPIGQALGWYEDVILCVPRSGQVAARQIARLCGDDSQVTVPLRSLADAVGLRDSAGRDSAYTRRGIECLVEAEWLKTDTAGSGQTISTTFYLMPGDRSIDWFPEVEDEWLELRE